MIAALFVQTGGVYWDLPHVDPWDKKRDAMLYRGPWPVVAHPPCARWCRLAGLVESVYGYKRGDDGGMFAHALHCVRTYGGVLEHPAYSDAWRKYNLPVPQHYGGWQRGIDGGWSCHVEQGRYGHPAQKATWLYAVGTDLPLLKWGRSPDGASDYLVSFYGNHVSQKMVSRLRQQNPRWSSDKRPRLRSREASATPAEFRDILIGMAASVRHPLPYLLAVSRELLSSGASEPPHPGGRGLAPAMKG